MKLSKFNLYQKDKFWVKELLGKERFLCVSETRGAWGAKGQSIIISRAVADT